MAKGAIKQRIEAATEALGFRRYLLAPLFGAVIGFADWILSRLEEAGVSNLTGVPSWAIGVLVALLLIAYWLLEHIVKLRQRLTPGLSIVYDDRAQDCHKTVQISSDGGKTHHFGRSIRLRISCSSDVNVEQCSGVLTRIEYRAHGGSFSDIPLYEPAYLHWAMEEPTPFEPVTVYPRIHRYLGICRTDEYEQGFKIRLRHRSFVTPESFNDIGEYKFQIEVVAARTPTISRTLLIVWNGKWNEIIARLMENA